EGHALGVGQDFLAAGRDALHGAAEVVVRERDGRGESEQGAAHENSEFHEIPPLGSDRLGRRPQSGERFSSTFIPARRGLIFVKRRGGLPGGQARGKWLYWGSGGAGQPGPKARTTQGGEAEMKRREFFKSATAVAAGTAAATALAAPALAQASPKISWRM